jgi:hypothetical protein
MWLYPTVLYLLAVLTSLEVSEALAQTGWARLPRSGGGPIGDGGAAWLILMAAAVVGLVASLVALRVLVHARWSNGLLPFQRAAAAAAGGVALLALVGWAVAANLNLGISLGTSFVLLAACTQWRLRRPWLVLLMGPAFIVVVFFLGVAVSEALRR